MKLKDKAKAQLLNWLGIELEYQDGELWNIFFDGHQIPSGANSFAGNMHRLRQIERLERKIKRMDKLRVINFILSVTALLLAIRNAIVR